MLDAARLVGLIQQAVYREARRTRAFEAAEVVDTGAGGSLNVRVSGMGTVKEVVRMADAPAQSGKKVLMLRQGGSLQNGAALARAPYVTGSPQRRTYTSPYA
jgi:hypothetical protein